MIQKCKKSSDEQFARCVTFASSTAFPSSTAPQSDRSCISDNATVIHSTCCLVLWCHLCLWPSLALAHTPTHSTDFWRETPNSCFSPRCFNRGWVSGIRVISNAPRSSNFTSDVSFSPSARRILSICLLLVIASFWFFELMQPMVQQFLNTLCTIELAAAILRWLCTSVCAALCLFAFYEQIITTELRTMSIGIFMFRRFLCLYGIYCKIYITTLSS